MWSGWGPETHPLLSPECRPLLPLPLPAVQGKDRAALKEISFILPPSLPLWSLQAYGEEVVKEAFPRATIIRPADIYGHEDRFLSYYASMRGFPFHLVPILDRGNNTHKLPVYVRVGVCVE